MKICFVVYQLQAAKAVHISEQKLLSNKKNNPAKLVHDDFKISSLMFMEAGQNLSQIRIKMYYQWLLTVCCA